MFQNAIYNARTVERWTRAPALASVPRAGLETTAPVCVNVIGCSRVDHIILIFIKLLFICCDMSKMCKMSSSHIELNTIYLNVEQHQENTRLHLEMHRLHVLLSAIIAL